MRTSLVHLVLSLAFAAAAFAGGYVFARRAAEAPTASFHDMRVRHAESLSSLVDEKDAAVARLARRLGTPEAAYLFVRDRIAFEPARPAGAPGETVRAGAGSCLGKAALLASLYRALGMDHGEVRVLIGQVAIGGEVTEHAWLELEHGGECLQQDPTELLGTFEFAQFRDTEYTKAFVWRELFCFNDEGFAVVSPLNRHRGPGGAVHPGDF